MIIDIGIDQVWEDWNDFIIQDFWGLCEDASFQCFQHLICLFEMRNVHINIIYGRVKKTAWLTTFILCVG